MAMSSLTIEKLCSIGCNVTINSSDYSAISLEKYAAIMAKKNGILTIKNCSIISSITLEKLAAIGKEHIVLDFTV